MFKDRTAAGKLLAKELGFLKGRRDVVVLAVPRGGVVVAKEVAASLEAELDLVIARKIGAPGNPEYAIGSVTQDGEVIVEKESASALGVTEEYLKREASEQSKEIRARIKNYRAERPYPVLAGKTVVIVDDGLATGYTMMAAILSVKKSGAAGVIVAVPVGPRDTVAKLSLVADEVVCLDSPGAFYAVGEFYEHFDQVDDEAVREALGKGPS